MKKTRDKLISCFVVLKIQCAKQKGNNLGTHKRQCICVKRDNMRNEGK